MHLSHGAMCYCESVSFKHAECRIDASELDLLRVFERGSIPGRAPASRDFPSPGGPINSRL